MQEVVNLEVAAYPDCMQTGCNVMAVICQDEIGLLACYVGIVQLAEYDPDKPEIYQESKRRAADFVARLGQKQTGEQARKYFMFSKGKYRE